MTRENFSGALEAGYAVSLVRYQIVPAREERAGSVRPDAYRKIRGERVGVHGLRRLRVRTRRRLCSRSTAGPPAALYHLLIIVDSLF